MSKKVSFVLNTGYEGGQTVLEDMARVAVLKAADRIAERANRISPAMRQHPNTFAISKTGLADSKRGGGRFYAIVSAETPSGGEAYNLDKQALHLALDAGRVGRLSG